MEALLADLRYALRTLAKSPGFALIVVLTLAFGIGANTAIFSVVNGVLLTPLPYKDPSRLVVVWESKGTSNHNVVNPANYMDWHDRATSFSGLALTSWTGLTFTGDQAEQVQGRAVTPDFFGVLGATPLLGSTFNAEESRPNGPRVIVLSEALWRRRFGADRAIVGRAVPVAGGTARVVGVMPASFRPMPLGHEQYWEPMPLDWSNRARNGRYAMAVGRLRDGVTIERAQTEMSRIARQLESDAPNFDTGWSATVGPLMGQGGGAAHRRHPPRPPGARRDGPGVHGRGRAVWFARGVEPLGCRDPGPARRHDAHDGGRACRAAAWRARHRADVAGDRAAGRRRTPGALPAPADRRRSRLRSRQHIGGDDHAAARDLPRQPASRRLLRAPARAHPQHAGRAIGGDRQLAADDPGQRGDVADRGRPPRARPRSEADGSDPPRGPGLLRRDAHPAQAGPLPRDERPARQRAGGRDQRSDGTQAVAGRRPDRPARQGRLVAPHRFGRDRRRRGRFAPRRARCRVPADAVLPVRAGVAAEQHEPRPAHDAPACDTDPHGPCGRLRDGHGPPGRRCRDDVPPHCRDDGGPSLPGVRAGPVRGAGAHVGRGGDLRGAVVHRPPAHARDRCAPSAGCPARRRAPHGARRRPAADAQRGRAGRYGRGARRGGTGQAPLRRAPAGPGDVRHRDPGTGRRRAARDGCSGAPRRAGRSDGGVAV